MKTTIDYNHSSNTHTIDGPRTAIPFIFADSKPQSLIDVGCGIGTWLKAAVEFGVPDVFGVDGVQVEKDDLLIPENLFRNQDLTEPWSLGRRFDAALCLEVGEHLDEACAAQLVESLVAHADLIYFSAACPDQPGQHHVNCRWPAYWQHLFNQHGFVCSDAIRWQIWDKKEIEVWYRQNLFSARKDPRNAASEPRIPAVVHPEMHDYLARHTAVRQVEAGRMGLRWYAKIPFLALKNKLTRRLCALE